MIDAGYLRNLSTEELKNIEAVIRGVAEAERLNNPVSSFVPNGAVERFMGKIGQEKNLDGRRDDCQRIHIFAAGNGVGKTACVTSLLANVIWGPQNKWFGSPVLESWPWPKKFWYVSEQTTLKTTVCGIEESDDVSIRRWFPKRRYSFTKAGETFFSHIKSDTGWSGSFKTYDMIQKKFESDTIGLIILDEPPPQHIYNACVARLRQGGMVWMPMTPLQHSAWVFDELVSKADQVKSRISVTYGDIEENCKQHGVRGILDHADIEIMLAQYDEEELAARKSGKPTHLSGRIFTDLHPDIHRKIPAIETITQDKYRIVHVVDPHDVRPPAMAWFGVGEGAKRAFAIDEFPDMHDYPEYEKIQHFNMTTSEVIAMIREKEIFYGWDPTKIKRVMDPNFGRKKHDDSGLTVQQYWHKLGRQMEYPMRFTTKVLDDLASGHKHVKDMLKVADDGNAALTIGPACSNLWRHANRYARKRREGKRADIDGQGERVAEKYKDFVDVLRYFVMFLRGPRVGFEDPVDPMPEHFKMYHERRERIILPGSRGWRDPFSV